MAFTTINNTDAQNYNFLLKGNLKMQVNGVKSVSGLTVTELADTSTYRDTIDVGLTGREWMKPVLTGTTEYTSSPISGGGIEISNVPDPVLNISQYAADLTATVSITDPKDIPFEEGDEFNHIPPHPLLTSQTIFFFWSATGATGNLLASIPWTEIRAYSVMATADPETTYTRV